MILTWKLDCTRCGEITDFESEAGRDTVKCTVCGKRHGYKSTVHVRESASDDA
jgi:DNA-directed RNA polymerase subunit RPC12/RpoP